ncbi:transporter substrate-binding domain-containing protein [Photobacterium japonica]|uniref:substrate-binding periplasmic protein n=1 Tax=Photobacterium japonica TaxID=2910235 RepID=UPI003D1368CB
MYKFIVFCAGLLLPLSAYSEPLTTVNYYVIKKQAVPFQIENGDSHSGIVTDIVHAVFKDSPYTLAYHAYPFNRMISVLENGGEANWITYGSPAWGGVQAANLSSQPIYTVKHALLSRQGSTLSFNTMQDLQDKVVVLLHGFSYPELMPYIEDGTIDELRVKDYAAAIRVINRSPDDTTFVEMASRIKYHLKKGQHPSTEYNLTSFSQVIPDYSIYLAFDPDMDSNIQDFINHRLATLHDAGDIAAIIEQYN